MGTTRMVARIPASSTARLQRAASRTSRVNASGTSMSWVDEDSGFMRTVTIMDQGGISNHVAVQCELQMRKLVIHQGLAPANGNRCGDAGQRKQAVEASNLARGS